MTEAYRDRYQMQFVYFASVENLHGQSRCFKIGVSNNPTARMIELWRDTGKVHDLQSHVGFWSDPSGGLRVFIPTAGRAALLPLSYPREAAEWLEWVLHWEYSLLGGRLPGEYISLAAADQISGETPANYRRSWIKTALITLHLLNAGTIPRDLNEIRDGLITLTSSANNNHPPLLAALLAQRGPLA